MDKYIILGGGIAGLATAIQLLNKGKSVELFEKSPKNQAQGHAFILMPNGLAALEKIGVKEAVLKVAHPITNFQLHNTEGVLETQQHLSCALGIRRGVLVDILTKALPVNFTQHEKAFSHFEKDGNGYIEKAVFTDGTKCAGNVFIGADGIWSKARKTVCSDFSLSPVRIREIVSVIKAPKLVEEFNGTFIKVIRKSGGMAVGMLPCDDQHLVWFIQYDSQHPHLLDTPLAEQKRRLFQMTRNWCHPIPRLVAKTDFQKSYTWHTIDMHPIPNFHRKNLVLIGDAAHVLLTLTSQGVSSALEDAICLTDLINQSTDKFEFSVLDRFSNLRRERMEEYFHLGRDLREQFLFPMQNIQKMDMPLIYSEA